MDAASRPTGDIGSSLHVLLNACIAPARRRYMYELGKGEGALNRMRGTSMMETGATAYIDSLPPRVIGGAYGSVILDSVRSRGRGEGQQGKGKSSVPLQAPHQLSKIRVYGIVSLAAPRAELRAAQRRHGSKG